MNIKPKDTTDSNKFDNNTNSRTIWKTVKTLTNNNKQTPPRLLSHEGRVVTSLKTICNIANDFYVMKIKYIRNKFPINDKTTPIEVLSKLIKRNNISFTINHFSIEQIGLIIKKLNQKIA